jgi:hypothetical protein
VDAALSCRDVARSRLEVVVDKFQGVIRDASDQETGRSGLAAPSDRGITDGTNALTAGKTDCATAGMQFAELERALSEPDAGGASLEAMSSFDLSIESAPSFSRGERKASHKVWGKSWGKSWRTALDEPGTYRPIELE